jgi:PKD repeat protein
VSYAAPGLYPVTLTVTAGDISDTGTKQQYILVTPRDPLIYPNPAREWFDLQVPADYEVASFEMLNALGQVVGRWQTQNKTGRFSLAGISSGLYYIRIIQKNGQVTTQRLLVLK